MLNYESIVDANKGIKYTDVKGKNYAEVAQRVQVFRKLIPDGFITTDIISLEGGVVTMKAEAGYYENGQRVVLASGLAFEKQETSFINKTSYIENCETSAVGRALGFIGIGSEASIASVEELVNAINQQENMKRAEKPAAPAKPAEPAKPVKVTKSDKLPQAVPADPVSPVLEFLAKEREALRIMREMDKKENDALWSAQVKALQNGGIIPKKPLAEFTLEEAGCLVSAMYSNFPPKGAVMKNDGKAS